MTEKPPSPKPMKLTPRGADLADILAIVGFGGLMAGLALLLAPAWSLVIGGGLLISIGLVAAWRRGS